ncbi:SDR family oxidoreductase, partial [Bordetella pertussis]
VSSMGTRAAYPEMSVYAPAKAGLEALTLLLASDLGARGITVNAVLPGATATDMNTRARDPAMADALARDIALGRVGQPEDIADIVAFLASDQARWITGQRLDATGGQRL